MKNQTYKILRILFAAIVLISFPSLTLAMEDTIVAIVNKDVVTLKDLREYLAAKHMQLKSEGKSPSEIIEAMKDDTTQGLNRLIEEKLLVSESDKKELAVRQEIVEQKLTGVKKEYPSEAVFIEALRRDGLTITDLKNKIRDQLKAQSIIDYEVRSKIFVNPQEVTEYYEKNPQLFKKPEMVNLDTIFIKNETDPKGPQEKINKVLSLLKEKDFREVAQEYSASPSVGIIFKGQFKPSIEDVVFKLNIGDVSAPIATADGTYIFKIVAKLPEEVAALETVKEGIHNRIFQQKFRERLEEWLKKLKQDAYIDIKQ